MRSTCSRYPRPGVLRVRAAYVPAALSVSPGGVVQSQPWEFWHGRYLVGRGRTWRDAVKCLIWTVPPLRSALRRTALQAHPDWAEEGAWDDGL